MAACGRLYSVTLVGMSTAPTGGSAPDSGGPKSGNTTLDAVAHYLLENKFLLTGLELLQETVERGRQDIPAELREAFSKSKLDELLASDDIAPVIVQTQQSASQRPPEDQGRVALLEYELRMERNNLQTLRQELSSLLSFHASKAKPNAPGSATSAGGAKDPKPAPTSATEKRILNYLVKKYLVDNGYHLTAISLSSESETNPDSWTAATQIYGNPKDLVEPPGLQLLYRNFYGFFDPKKEQERLYEALEKAQVRASELKEQLSMKDKMDQQIKALQENVDLLKAELDETNAALKREREQVARLQGQWKEEAMRNAQFSQLMADMTLNPKAGGAQHAAEAPLNESTDSKLSDSQISSDKDHDANQQTQQPNTPSVAEVELPEFIKQKRDANDKRRRRNFNFLFRREELLDESKQRIAAEVMKIRTLQNSNAGTVSILASTLPHIVSGVILAKREELIPVIVAAICWHPDPKKRYDLTNVLFNLIKVPNEQQRRVIMDGLLYLSELVGSDRTSNELLPQCWEQISNKYEERRVLVADACGWLAPHVKPELRLSLLLSIVSQLAADRSALVRAATATNIARILQLDDNLEGADIKKFQQLADILFQLLQDPEPSVSAAAKHSLLPVFADWAERMNYFQQKFLPLLPYKMYQLVEKAGPQMQSNAIREFDLLAQVFAYLTPQIFESTLWGLPLYKEVAAHFEKTAGAQNAGNKFVSIFGDAEKKMLRSKFDEFVTSFERKKREEVKQLENTFEWIVYELVPTLVRILELVDMSNRDVCDATTHVLRVLASEFGLAFTKKILDGFFKTKLSVMMKNPKPDLNTRRARITVGFAASVLLTYEPAEIKSYLKVFLIEVTMKQNGWTGKTFDILRTAFQSLLHHSMDQADLLLDVLWELIVHQESKVRRNVVKLVQVIVPGANSNLLANRIVPALITLSSDSDMKVRRNTVRAFGDIVIISEDKNLLDKITTILGQFIDESPKFIVIADLIRTFASIAPRSSQNLRDNFILRKLAQVSQWASTYDEDENKQKELAELLFKAYRSLYGSSLSKEVVKEQLLPGLVSLSKIIDLAGNETKQTLITMIGNLEAQSRDDGSADQTAAQTFVNLLNPLNWQLSGAK